MHIQVIPSSGGNKDLEEYKKMVLSHPLGTIHQLPEWGEFQVKSGVRSKCWILVSTDQATQNDAGKTEASVKSFPKNHGQIEASALVLKQRLPFGICWLYVPRGPLMDLQNAHAAHELFTAIRDLAKKEKAVFARFDPPVPKNEEASWGRFFGDLKAKNAHAHYQPEATLMVDLTPSEEEILKQMKPKGRYNIKVAEKHGVKIRVSDGAQKDIEAFYSLLKTTTARDRFSSHPKKYYETMLKRLGPDRAKLYLAEYAPESGKYTPEVSDNSSENGGEAHGSMKSPSLTGSKHPPILLAAAMVTYFADTATYYFGASSNENRNVMAPYLLHWQAMKDAKNAGYKTYDFFGIAPEHSRNHPWQSVTEFKLKFGGRRVEYMDAQEIVYKPFWYWIMRVAKMILRK